MTWSLFKKHPKPEPIIAVTTGGPIPPTATVAPAVSQENATQISGPVESTEDNFAKFKEKLMNEIKRIPCK